MNMNEHGWSPIVSSTTIVVDPDLFGSVFGPSISSESGSGYGSGSKNLRKKIKLKKIYLFWDQKFQFTYP
jgi:hypothetical protein